MALDLEEEETIGRAFKVDITKTGGSHRMHSSYVN